MHLPVAYRLSGRPSLFLVCVWTNLRGLDTLCHRVQLIKATGHATTGLGFLLCQLSLKEYKIEIHLTSSRQCFQSNSNLKYHMRLHFITVLFVSEYICGGRAREKKVLFGFLHVNFKGEHVNLLGHCWDLSQAWCCSCKATIVGTDVLASQFQKQNMILKLEIHQKAREKDINTEYERKKERERGFYCYFQIVPFSTTLVI